MNRITTAAIVAIGLWATLVFAPAIRAQGAGQTPPPGALTNESLKAMLDGLGYDPKEMDHGYVATLKRDGWADGIQFGLSSDGTKLGLNSYLGSIEKPDAVTAAQWKKLLEDNFVVNPSFISLDPKSNRLFMVRVLDNHGITAAYLRQQVDNFCTNIHGTAADWRIAGSE